MEFNNQALILKIGRFREADLWVRFFSREQGLLTAFAFGGSRSRRRFCGCLDSLNHVHFKVRRSSVRDYLCLMEGVLLSSPKRIRTDSARLGMAANCLRFMEAAAPGPEDAPRIYNLTLETLGLLDQQTADSSILPSFYKASLLFKQSFWPDLEHCAGCGADLEQSGGFLGIDQGLMLCPACRPRCSMPVRLDPDALNALRSLPRTPPSLWPGIFNMPQASKQAFSRAVDAMISYHLGLHWANGRFMQR